MTALLPVRTLVLGIMASWLVLGCIKTEDASATDESDELVGTATSPIWVLPPPVNVPFISDDMESVGSAPSIAEHRSRSATRRSVGVSP
jgi:hypothetical protein